MWKAAREEFKEIVWLVCIIGGLSGLGVLRLGGGTVGRVAFSRVSRSPIAN